MNNFSKTEQKIILNFEPSYIIGMIKKNKRFFGIVPSSYIIAKVNDLALYHPKKEVAANEYFCECLFDKWVDNSLKGMNIHILDYSEKDMELDKSMFNSWGYQELLNTLKYKV